MENIFLIIGALVLLFIAVTGNTKLMTIILVIYSIVLIAICGLEYDEDDDETEEDEEND